MNKNIDFWEQRDFGTLIGAPFYFLRQEFKPFTLVLLKYAGPFLGIAVLGLGSFSVNWYNVVVQDYRFENEPEYWYLLLFAFFMAIGFFAVFLLSNAYIAMYVRKGKGNFTENDVAQLARKKAFSAFGLGFLNVLMVMVGFLLLYIPGIYLAIALSFVYIAHIYEDKSVGQSISRSFQIVSGKWWYTFGLIFLFGMIVGFTSYIFFIPGYLIGIFAMITDSFGIMQVALIIVFAALYFAAYLYMLALQQILIGFHFFNLITQKEGGNLESRIKEIYPEETVAADDTTLDDEFLTDNDEIIETSVTDDDNDKWKKKDESEKPDDNFNRFADKSQKNRFTGDDDEDIDPYKPKY